MADVSVGIKNGARRGALWLRLLLALGAGGCADDGEKTPHDMQQQPAQTGDASADAGSTATQDAGPTLGPVSADGLVVRFSSGSVRGKLEGPTREFLGIPYGKAERFAAPQPADAWSDERDATNHGPSCAQSMGTLSPMVGGFDENCLTVNVYTPQSTAAGGLPVYVFIHGGAFISGGSVQYDGQKLSERGPLVVVTLNYRLGVLGFLSHAGLDAARGEAPAGNDGIRDQQLALRWVQSNIAAFGGDPSKVTIAGESAGAMSACLHLVSPLSRELGQRFVFESGVCMGGTLLANKASADKLGKELSDELCAGQPDLLQCLRAKPLQELTDWRRNATMFGAGFAPVVNPADPLLPDLPPKLIEAGNYNKGTVLAGSNLREWGLFQLIGSAKPATIADFNAAVDSQLGAQLGAAGLPLVKEHYKPASDAEANDVFVRLMTDAAFRCPTRTLARLASSKGSKVFLYSFEQGNAFHAYELPYVFGNPNALLAPVLDEPTLAALQGFWMQFATTGDPNGRVQPTWPAYEAGSDQHMALSSTSQAGSGLSKADCDFWDSLTAAR
jgi:para-nitrobenzyl esterase